MSFDTNLSYQIILLLLGLAAGFYFGNQYSLLLIHKIWSASKQKLPKTKIPKILTKEATK